MQNNQAPKVLYVEDDPGSRTLVSRVLQSEGYRVVMAPDGLSGIRMAVAERPDLVLMDINMGDLDGYEVTTRLRSTPGMEKTPIIALTANVMAGDRERALIAGCDGYIPKPIDVDLLPHQLQIYLSGQRERVAEPERSMYLEEYSRKLVERLEGKVIELEQANSALQKLDKMKSDFIALAAHELRTPITLVYGYARLLLTNYELKEEPQTAGSPADLAHRIVSSVNRLNEVVNDLLNISMIESNQVELDLVPTSVYESVEKAIAELLLLSEGRDLCVEIVDLDRLPPIEADKSQLHQVFWNIISNAIKYTPDSGRIRIWGREADAALDVVVQDTGIGIEPEEQSHIFDRFYVVEDITYHRSSKTAFMGGGMGLGLSIAQGIVEAHGGRIWVESEGRDKQRCPGSKFHVLLPISQTTHKDK
jgi:signal transduction histidine kinase